MAESIVQVTEGSGKKLHTFQRTIGANNVEDEIVVPGIQYLAGYQVPTGSTSTATANAHLLQIMAGGTLNVYIRWIKIFQNAVATTSIFDTIGIYRLTTAGTGGTAITPLALDSTDAASGATAMTLPTVKGTEAANLIDVADMFMLQTLPTAVDFTEPRMKFEYGEGSTGKFLRIPAGTANGIAVKNLIAVAGATVHIVASIFEANF